MSTQLEVEYYFSFLSPWSYLGSRRLHLLARETNVKIVYKPINILQLFAVSGGVPLKQRAPQRQAYRLLEMERWHRIREVPIVQFPKFYPVDPSLAHRVLLAAIAEEGHESEAVRRFAMKGPEAVWADELDIADPETIIRLATECGLDGARLLERAQKDDDLAKQEETLTQEAISRAYFGLPVYCYRGEPFWGQDRLEILEEVIRSGREPFLLPEISSS